MCRITGWCYNAGPTVKIKDSQVYFQMLIISCCCEFTGSFWLMQNWQGFKVMKKITMVVLTHRV